MHSSSRVNQGSVKQPRDQLASRRQLLLSPRSLQMIRSLPDSVRRYLDGGKADFDAASWALENNEVELFKQIHAEGFCFSPSQRQWHQEKKESKGHTQLATAAWPSVEYSCHEEIDSNNVHGLILLLGMSANFSTLKLNLSSRIDEQSLTELLNAIDALPRAPEVEIEIDSGCHGGIDRKLGFALASSRTCLSTPRVRSWIIQNMIHAIGNPKIFQIDCKWMRKRNRGHLNSIQK